MSDEKIVLVPVTCKDCGGQGCAHCENEGMVFGFRACMIDGCRRPVHEDKRCREHYWDAVTLDYLEKAEQTMDEIRWWVRWCGE